MPTLVKVFLCLSFSLSLASTVRAESRERRRTTNQVEDAWPFDLALIGIGDSLAHGTMDGTNNFTNTVNAFMQKVAESLSQRVSMRFSQPYFDEEEQRVDPFRIPTNLAVDGADIFSAEGLQYYKRAGVDQSFVTEDFLADKLIPRRLSDKYDKVLYPINVKNRQPSSQTDGIEWLLSQGLPDAKIDKAAVVFWLGNNDSSTAALGAGGSNPQYLPFPLDVIERELSPELRVLLRFGERTGQVSFDPYTQVAVERNLTDVSDFVAQLDTVLTRIGSASTLGTTNLFVLTLPYYNAVGYLFDSEDLEFYLKKLDSSYRVPPSFGRVAPAGEPITDPLQGDRVSVFTFGFMYALLSVGYSVDHVNQALEIDGQQRDGSVLSQGEQEFIMARIDDFNSSIKAVAAAHGAVTVIDIAALLNDALAGKVPVVIGGQPLSRKWVRGGAFTFDGVHPGYTAQALIANFILGAMNEILRIDAPAHDLEDIFAVDPYVDQDGDGWAPGPDYQSSGVTELLFLFKDPDDQNASVETVLPEDVWDQISEVLLDLILGNSRIRGEADRLGITDNR